MLTQLTDTTCSLDFFTEFLNENFAGACRLHADGPSQGSALASADLLPGLVLKPSEVLVTVPRTSYVRSRHVGGLTTGVGEPAALTAIILARPNLEDHPEVVDNLTTETRLLYSMARQFRPGTVVLCSPAIKKNDLSQCLLDLALVSEDYLTDYLILSANATQVYASLPAPSGGLRALTDPILLGAGAGAGAPNEASTDQSPLDEQ